LDVKDPAPPQSIAFISDIYTGGQSGKAKPTVETKPAVEKKSSEESTTKEDDGTKESVT
jgi:hypothetical protein